MRTTLAFRLLLGVALLCGVSAQNNGGTCQPTIPLPHSLLGRTFSMPDDCYRPISSTFVSVYQKMFILTINDGIPLQCAEAYLVVFRKPDVTPMIVKYPKIDVSLDALGGSASGEDVAKYCESTQAQRKEEMFPVTETKGKFVAAVKKMVPLMLKVRDFGCTTNADGFEVPVQGRAYDNADLEAVISYLYSVAFQYGFCI